MARPRDCVRLRSVDAAIEPEPLEDVRQAILAALETAGRVDPESAWWRAGIEEAVAADDEPG